VAVLFILTSVFLAMSASQQEDKTLKEKDALRKKVAEQHQKEKVEALRKGAGGPSRGTESGTKELPKPSGTTPTGATTPAGDKAPGDKAASPTAPGKEEKPAGTVPAAVPPADKSPEDQTPEKKPTAREKVDSSAKVTPGSATPAPAAATTPSPGAGKPTGAGATEPTTGTTPGSEGSPATKTKTKAAKSDDETDTPE
jgi:hypothetical protein